MAVLRPVRLGRRHPWQHLYDAASPHHVANEGSLAPGKSVAADRFRSYPSLWVTPGASDVTVLEGCPVGVPGRLGAVLCSVGVLGRLGPVGSVE